MTTPSQTPDDPTQTKPWGYVCRVHYAPVTPRGRGCRRCDKPLSMTRAQRRARRQKDLGDQA